MVFQSDTYSVLLVSASEKLNTAMAELLPPTDFFPGTVAGSLSQARRLTLETVFDLVLVNSDDCSGDLVTFVDLAEGSIQLRLVISHALCFFLCAGDCRDGNAGGFFCRFGSIRGGFSCRIDSFAGVFRSGFNSFCCCISGFRSALSCFVDCFFCRFCGGCCSFSYRCFHFLFHINMASSVHTVSEYNTNGPQGAEKIGL